MPGVHSRSSRSVRDEEFKPFTGTPFTLGENKKKGKPQGSLKRKAAVPHERATRTRSSIQVERVDCSSGDEDQYLKNIREMEYLRHEICKMSLCASTWKVPPGRYFDQLRKDAEKFNHDVETLTYLIEVATEEDLENSMLWPDFSRLAGEFAVIASCVVQQQVTTGPTTSSQDDDKENCDPFEDSQMVG